MALYVHHGPRLAALADGIVRRLGAATGDPFAPLVVAVPTAGVRDWLTRRLAEDLGVAANIDMPYPARFFATALGHDTDDDPWTVERLTWTVLDVLDAHSVDVPGWETACSGPASQRYLVARRVADLFDRYAAIRPEVLRQWRRGLIGDGTVRATAVGGGRELGDERTVGTLPPSMRWQYELWCRVRERIGTPSLAEATPELVEQLRRGVLVPALPSSVELFGVSSLSRPQLDVLEALAAGHDVHISLLHPSAVAWLRTEPIDRTFAVPRRRGDVEAVEADRHPQLRSWGRPSSEAAGLVRGLPPPATIAAAPDAVAAPAATLLAHLQADVAADRPPTPFARAPGDRSVQIHACHGATRQLEVLRDALGHHFVADPSLRPDDILVICPDLARFEPFIAAVFGRGALPIPVSVSDLSLGAENPVAAALAAILHTVIGRCAASEVLAVAGLDPVRRRLGITTDDLDRFAEWCDRVGTSWGLDVVHRRSWLAAEIEFGTWDHAVRSLLLGAAMPAPEPRLVGGTVLFDDVGGDDIARAGRLAELVARLRALHRLTGTSRSIGEWCDVFDDVLDRLCAAPPSESWQRAAALTAIDEVRRDAEVGGTPSAVPIAFDDAVAVVDSALIHRRGRVQLRTGRVSVTGSAPVRNVPARVVCVLGFDEPSLRPPGIDGDDLLAIRPCVGERERHAERRHLLLDALLAAEDALVVTCDGSDITTNREVRLAVPLSELVDLIDATLEPAGSAGESDTPVLVRHPLHSYAVRNFDLAATPPGGARSFDDAMCRAAEIHRQRSELAASSSAWQRFRVDCPIPATVGLPQLTDACVRPARALLRDGLDVRVPGEVEPIDHAIPLSLGSLGAASAGRRLLERYRRQAAVLRAAGGGVERWHQAAIEAVAAWSADERLGPAAPPGQLIDGALAGLAADLDVLVAAISAAGLDQVAVLGAEGAIDVDVELSVTGAFTARRADLPDRLRLVDRVGGLADGLVCRVGYQRPKPGIIVAAALDLAAVVLATGDLAWRALTATRSADGTGSAECHLLEITADTPLAAARSLLEVAAELRVAALTGPLPVFEATSKALYEKGFIDEDELIGTDFGRPGDLGDAHNHFVWGDVTAGELGDLEPSPLDLATAIWGAIDGFAPPREAGGRVVTA